jgi:dolichol-phosphate mannosyltransferase
MRILIAIPVFNEERYVAGVLTNTLRHARQIERSTGHRVDVLVVDDGSTDGTPGIVVGFPVSLSRRTANAGYGRSMRDAFRWAQAEGYDWLITMDCDEQHEPAALPGFVRVAEDTAADVISGTRYLRAETGNDRPPPDRRRINLAMTAEINARLAPALGCVLTDAFCGFKAYRVAALANLALSVEGYAFPMQFWAQAGAQRMRVVEHSVRLIYNDLARTFGDGLDDPERRLRHYRRVLHREILRQRRLLPQAALRGVTRWAALPPRCEDERSAKRESRVANREADAHDGSAHPDGRAACTVKRESRIANGES